MDPTNRITVFVVSCLFLLHIERMLYMIFMHCATTISIKRSVHYSFDCLPQFGLCLCGTFFFNFDAFCFAQHLLLSIRYILTARFDVHGNCVHGDYISPATYYLLYMYYSILYRNNLKKKKY